MKSSISRAIWPHFAAGVLCLSLTAVLSGCGCSKNEEPASPTAETDPVKNRMKDPAYIGKLQKQRKEQTDILKRMAEAKKRLAEAEAAGAAGEELTALTNAVRACYDELEANRRRSERIVAKQMHKSIDEAKQRQNNLKEKGN